MEWNSIDACIQDRSVLKHPFYQAWTRGELTKDDLRYYAGQYYALEAVFPRLLSRIHSSCEDAQTRQAVLENLIDEERGAENHRELWLRFAEGLGLDRDAVVNAPLNGKTRAAVSSLMDLAAHPNPAVGLAALYAYESQLPQVSVTKMDGLRRFYGFDDARALRFFEVHREADVWHSEEEKKAVLASGTPIEEVRAAADQACRALLTFLDGVEEATLKARGHACSAA